MNSITMPILALTPGDPTGIGPELVAKVLASEIAGKTSRFVLVGDRRVFEMGARQAGVEIDCQAVNNAQEAREALADRDSFPLLDLENLDPDSFEIGRPDPAVGKKVGDTLEAATRLAEDGGADGVVFAPLNKQAMFRGGWNFPDEHKLFAHLLRFSGPFSEMNVLEGQWMTRVTSHVSLREALDQITPDRIRRALILAHDTLKAAGIEHPRIAVSALNPHAGEGGLFGREEIEIIAPVVREMAEEGYSCSGPYPSDTVYLKAFAGEFDSVLAMYHDQGQIATKLKGFNKGVTVTAGLPIIFATPAHGTAYDIVGQGVADPGATFGAIQLAATLARRKALAKIE